MNNEADKIYSFEGPLYALGILQPQRVTLRVTPSCWWLPPMGEMTHRRRDLLCNCPRCLTDKRRWS